MSTLSCEPVLQSNIKLPNETAATKTIIPAPSFLGSLLCERRSTRDFSGRALSQKHLDRLLVDTAGGVYLDPAYTEDGKVFELLLRTIPQGGAICSVRTHLILPKATETLASGLYQFCHQTNALHYFKKSFDQEILYKSFPYIKTSELDRVAAAFIISANFEFKSSKYKVKGRDLCMIEVGCALQNLSLSATDLGIAGYAVGGYNEEFINECFDLPYPRETVCTTFLAGMPANQGEKGSHD